MKKLITISLAVIFLSSFIVPHEAFSSPIFTPQLNLSDNGGISQAPQIATSASNVYAVWQDDDSVFNNDIRFKASSDNGTSFGSEINLSNNATESISPKIAASGNNVYVVWQDGNNIDFVRSTNNGSSFDTAIDLVPSAVSAQVPQIAKSGNNVYVVWQDNGDIFFNRSINGGASFIGAINLSGGTGTSSIPQVTTSGSNVYVAWANFNLGNSEILFASSADNGANFGGIQNLSNSVGFSDLPHVAANANHVYVVWSDTGGATDIFLSKSNDNGTSFSAAIDLENNVGVSTNPQISTTGSSVYVTWNDNTPGNNDILFMASANNATNFDSAINLSSNSGESVNPLLCSHGNFVYVAWQDFTNDPSNGEVLLRSSSDGGTTFAGIKNLSNNAGNSGNTVHLATNNDNKLYVVWEDTTPDTLNFPPQIPDILFVSGSASDVDLSFNKSQYKISETAKIIVNDTSSNTNATKIETISPVTITSTSDPNGVTLDLAETGPNTGVFTGNVTFTSGLSSGSTLKVSAGDTITAKFVEHTGIASIFPRTIYFGTPSFPLSIYDQGNIASVTVEDQNSNTNSTRAETINIHIASLADPTGIPLTLTETGPNTGVFGNDNIIFTANNYLFPISGTLTVTQADLNVVGPDVDVIQDTVTSTSDPVGIHLNLTETGNTTSIFTGKLNLSPNQSNAATRQIHVQSGDFVHFTYASGSVVTNGLITPNPNPENGAIHTLVTPAAPDTVTATYLGTSGSAIIDDLYGPGGGGGGLVRPGLILDVVASLSGGGNNPVPPMFSLAELAQTPGNLPDDIRQQVLKHDPAKPLLPQYDTTFDYPLIIDGAGYVLGGYQNTITTISEKAGTPIALTLNLPATNLVHLSLYTNLGGKSREIQDSDTYIIYDKGQSLQKVDPHGLFSSIKFDLDTNGVHNKILYTITFAKEMPKSDVIFRAWNDRSSSADVKLHDVFEVQGPQVTSSSLSQTLDNSSQPLAVIQSQAAPQNGQNTDLTDTIKDWGGFSSHPISDSEFLSHMGLSGKTIPKWVSSTTKYVVNNDMTEQDFENLVKYLASNGIIK